MLAKLILLAQEWLSRLGIATTSSKNMKELKGQANPKVTDLLSRFKISCATVLHVGGHYAEEAQEYFEYGIDRAVFIEGDSTSFTQLQLNVSKYKNFSAIKSFVSDTSGLAIFYQASNAGASSSLLKPGRHSKERPDILFSEGIKVETQTLDSLNLGEFDLVVIDVQGAEMQVLKGGQKTALSAKAIWIEVNSGGMYSNDAGTQDIFAYLMETHSPVYLNLNENYWGDALFIRAELLPK